MKNYILDKWKGLRDWSVSKIKSKYAAWWLGLFAFTDAVFSPIPPDIFMIPMVLARKTKWLLYSFITSSLSVIGAFTGYLIGFWLFDVFGQQIISFYGIESQFAQVSEMFASNAFLAIFVGAFTPLPYKVFAISAGLFKINLIIFFIASALGRSIRYFLIGYLVFKYGSFVSEKINKYSRVLKIIFALTVLYILFF